MQATNKNDYQQEWVRILAKGMITLPKSFREELDLREGEIARIKKIGKKLIIEPREETNYEVYSDKELREMLKRDKLPLKLSKIAASLWKDIR